jgi:hypothetical protein
MTEIWFVVCFLTYADGDIVIDCEQISSKGIGER